MKRILIGMAAAVVLTLAADKAQEKAQDAERQLKAAMNTELVDGNLKSAIEQYRKIAQSSNRAVAAQALLHMAGCYQKSGDAEAKKIYERIVREYGDQTQVVASARAQLGAPSGEAAARRIWTAPLGADVPYSNASADGRFMTYIDYSVDNLFVQDLRSGASRQVTDSNETGIKGDFPEENAFSSDGKQLAYAWFKSKENRWEIRAVDLTGSGVPKYRRVYDNPEIQWIGPDDWSPDGKWLAVGISRKDHTQQIGLVSVQDGTLRILTSSAYNRLASRLLFSPDGRYLAYDAFPDATRSQHDVFLIALDSGVETPVVVSPMEDYLMGWSPDGGRLILLRTGRGADSGLSGLWSQAVANGKPQGTPEFLRWGVTGSCIRLTSSGTLLSYVVNSLGSSIRVADFDFRTGRFLSSPANPVQEVELGNVNPVWSPDGKSLAYLSGKNRRFVAIRSLDTGKMRRLEKKLRWVGYDLDWSPDGRSFAVSGIDPSERGGIFRVDAETGDVSPLAMTPDGHRFSNGVWSSDGTKLYYRDGPAFANGPDPVTFRERDVSTGVERDLIRRDFLGSPWLSPDGKFIATGTLSADRKTGGFVLISLSGERPRDLFTGQENLHGIWSWAPDGKSFFVRKGTGDAWEVWRVPIDGSAPQKIDLKADASFGALRVNAVSRRVAFQVQEAPKPTEVWAMENFIPPTAKSAR